MNDNKSEKLIMAEEEFYAPVKRNEGEDTWGTPYWAYDTRNGKLSSFHYTGYHWACMKMTKREWNELGVDESLSDFSKSL